MLISPQYVPVVAIAVLLLGILVGAVAARLVLPSRRQLRRLTAELETARAEHAAYRASVTTHFETTSDLVASMTASYKAVYDHLAAGAQTLCDGSKALEDGQFGAPRLVFDQRVDVERMDSGVAAAPTATPDVPALSSVPPPAELSSALRSDGRDAPILEMTKKAADDVAPTDDAASSRDDPDDARPSLH